MGKRQANDMIHCSVCGEDYSASYKRCPFCEEERRASQRKEPEYEDDYEDEEYDEEDEPTGGRRVGGGKRLLGVRRRGGGYTDGPTPGKIIRTVISLALIVAAIFIVVTLIKPLVDRGRVDGPDPNATPTPTLTPNATPTPVTTPPDATATPDPVETDDSGPEATSTPDIPASQTAESFTLSKNDISISPQYPDPYTFIVTFYPRGTTGTITWTSSNPAIATVDANGTVRGVGKGTATITATMAGGYTQTCLVRSSMSGSSSGGSTAPKPTGSLSEDGVYSVVSGDTLSGIATKYNTTVAAIKTLNGLTSDSIYVGQKIKIPSSSAPSTGGTEPPVSTATPAPSSGKTYTVVSGDTLSGIAGRNKTTVDAIKTLNGLTSDNIYIGQVLKLP